MTLGRPVKFTEDRREHFISSAHERGQMHHVEVGFDDDGRLLGLTSSSGTTTAPTRRTVSSSRSSPRPSCSAPTSRATTGSSSSRSTPTPSSSRPTAAPDGRRAASSMERTMDAIAAYLGKDRTEVRAVNFIQPDEFPYDHGLIFQDGRELVYDSGDYPALAGEAQGARRLGRVRGVPRRDGARRAAGSGSASPATSKAPVSGPTRARTSTSSRGHCLKSLEDIGPLSDGKIPLRPADGLSLESPFHARERRFPRLKVVRHDKANIRTSTAR